MSKIVSIHGAEYEPQTYPPNVNVIAELESMLKDARDGYLVGLACVNCARDGSWSYLYAGRIAGYGAIGCLYSLMSKLNAVISRGT